MTPERLIQLIESSNRPPFLYHFTDTRNIPSIVQHGLLSRTEIEIRAIQGTHHGGNQWSFEQDDRMGVSDYVHLCFFNQHPMEFLAKKDGRIEESYFIKILPKVLERSGVRFCAGVSNSTGRQLLGFEDLENHLDLEILFKRTDWREQEVQERLKAAKKYEILFPKKVPKSLLRK